MKALISGALLCGFAASIFVGASLSVVQAREVSPPGRPKIKVQIGVPDDINAKVKVAGEKVDGLYETLGPKFGVYLTNANVILLLANERALADVVLRGWHSDDMKSVEKFNKVAEQHGIRLTVSPTDLGKPDGDNVAVDAWFESLNGYEFVSHHTTVPGVLKFRASEGWDGLEAWKKSTIAELDKCAEKGVFPPTYKAQTDKPEQWYGSKSSTTAILNGVAFGYPDTAVMPKESGTWVNTDIAYADFHLGNEPNFGYLRETADLKAVGKHTKRWGTLLGEYYHSPQYLRLMHNADFKRARDTADNFVQP